MKRVDGRRPDQLRPVSIHPDFVAAPAGSVLIEMGNTRVICAASVEEGVPRWMRNLKQAGKLVEIPVRSAVAAISVGLLDGVALLDLCYEEDSKAAVDMNVVMTDEGHLVELQGTGEDAPFSKKQMMELLKLG